MRDTTRPNGGAMWFADQMYASEDATKEQYLALCKATEAFYDKLVIEKRYDEALWIWQILCKLQAFIPVELSERCRKQ